MPEAKIILASKSAGRRTMLENAGLHFNSVPSDLDEAHIIDDLKGQGRDISFIALELAKAKALYISKQYPDALVIGSDQILELDGQLISKANTAQEARTKLEMLRGKKHTLISAVSVARGEEILWHDIDEAQLVMRDVSDKFLDLYCEKAGDALVHCVGAYELEGLGSWLFSSIKGDYFTILGMPLLPVLGYLSDAHGATP